MLPFEDEFLIAWFNSYTLYVKGAVRFVLEPEEELTCSLAPDAARSAPGG